MPEARTHVLLYETFCYLIEPVVPIKSLEQIFTEPDRAFSEIQSLVRKQLLEPKTGTGGDEKFDLEWVHKGTERWEDFSSFVFDETGVVVLFGPYQVACYAAGPSSIKVEYSRIAPFMKPVYINALRIEHIMGQLRLRDLPSVPS
jgi:hypothetical protein